MNPRGRARDATRVPAAARYSSEHPTFAGTLSYVRPLVVTHSTNQTTDELAIDVSWPEPCDDCGKRFENASHYKQHKCNEIKPKKAQLLVRDSIIEKAGLTRAVPQEVIGDSPKGNTMNAISGDARNVSPNNVPLDSTAMLLAAPSVCLKCFRWRHGSQSTVETSRRADQKCRDQRPSWLESGRSFQGSHRT